MAAGAKHGHTAGEAPQRRRTRHSGVDVMEALDDPDIMLRSDPNLNAKITWQVRHWCHRSPASLPQYVYFAACCACWPDWRSTDLSIVNTDTAGSGCALPSPCIIVNTMTILPALQSTACLLTHGSHITSASAEAAMFCCCCKYIA